MRRPTRNSTSIQIALAAGLLVFLLFSRVAPAVAAAPSNEDRFRLGPTYDEYERSLSGSTTTETTQQAPIGFSQQEWNRMRNQIEGGQQPGEVLPPPEVSTKTVTPPKPPPGLLQVELPYESSLSVTGRKVIKLDIEETHISKQRADEIGSKQDSQTFNMQQELQARIQGTVARKTTINVNFDDTKENVRDFSVVYKGDPDEVVQEAAFGDIVLSLPSTEFVNYNKQLFGIRTSLRYKKFGFMAIGSRTKGTTETKRFTGTSTRQQVFINDTAYLRKKFYDMTFLTPGATMYNPGNPFDPGLGRVVLPINGAVPETVYIEDNTTNPLAQTFNIAYPTAPLTNTVSIRVRQMSPGVEYTIDRARGIITFVNPVPDDARVAIDFTLASGQRLKSLVAGGVALLIKERNPETEPVSQEIKRFYSAGSKNLVRDNGLGNFIFKVLDKNRQSEIGSTLSPPQRYPDNIEVQFETGIFEVHNPLGPDSQFPGLYSPTVNAASPINAVFSLEYQSILRTYTLRPNIVLQSEVVMVNGRKVTRDIDYFIDYDVGIITFFNEDLIRESTVIEVTYEFAPFGGTLGETLVGARGTYDILANQHGAVSLEKWNAGSTVLYNFAAKPAGPPDVRSTPGSLLVTEGDTQLKGLKFGSMPVNSNMVVEAARSAENPNIFGKAIIDSMEGIKQEDATSLVKDSWQIAANPTIAPFNTSNLVTDFRGRDVASSHIRWTDADVPIDDPNQPKVTQKALEVVYDLNTKTAAVPEQASLVTVLSVAGRDFSKKTTLEVEVEGAGAAGGTGVEMLVDFGEFNEDADGSGVLKTEDRIPFNDVLDLGEDIGYEFQGPGDDLVKGTGDDFTAVVGASNGLLDSEDLNHDHILSRQDLPVFITKPIFYLSPSEPPITDVNGNSTTDLSFTGRRLFQIPIDVNSLTDEEKARLTAVRQVRVTLRNSNAGTPRSGVIRIVRVSMVGNTYEPATVFGAVGSTMTVRAINNKDDPTVYTSLIGDPNYNELYAGAVPDNTAKEQALALDFDLQAGASATTRNLFSAPRDFSRHDVFRFFLRRPVGVAPPGTFFMQVGSETDFQQAAIDVPNIPDDRWLLVTLNQIDSNGDGTPDTWVSVTPNVTVTKVGGAPNLTQVAQIKLGVANNTGSEGKGEVWVNEIHESHSHERIGHANRYGYDGSWARWADFGGNYRKVDRNWETPTTAITNQDHTLEDGYVNFNRISFLPMSFKQTRDLTVTPSAFQANQNALVSVLEEGRVQHDTKTSTAKLLIPKLPVVDVSYLNDAAENTVTQRRELTDTLNVGANYSPKIGSWDFAPGPLTFRPLPTSITYLYTHRSARVRFPGLDELVSHAISTSAFSSTDVTQFADENEVRMAIRPWDGFTFNPIYKLRIEKQRQDFRVDELKDDPAAAQIDRQLLPKAQAQTVGASGNLKLLSWLNPRYQYTVSGNETNNIPTFSNPLAYQLKTINRTSDGEVSGAVQMNQVFKRSKFFNSMNVNSSYRLEDGDTYNDVPMGVSWRENWYVGHPLNISTGTLANSTDRKTFRTNVAWHPFSAYTVEGPRLRPLKSTSLTSNYLNTIENATTTGTPRRTVSTTFPDLVLTINDFEKMFGLRRGIDNSRLVFRNNVRKTETISITKSLAESYGADYQFQVVRKYDVSTSYNQTHQREDNLVINELTSKTDTRNYSIQTRIPAGVWAYTPRYEHSQTDARDSVRVTNDLHDDIYSLQIYGDISKPLGIRLGRKELGLANRAIINSTIKWDKKRATIDPGTNYLDTYSLAGTADYTISQNFRLAVGANFADEVHHPDFRKLDRLTYGISSTLTIQF